MANGRVVRGWGGKLQLGHESSDLIGFCGATPAARPTYTTTNVTTDRSIDADAAVAVIGDGLCTLIEDLKAMGILQ